MSERRRLTLLVVPHDKLNTRTFEISYRLLKFLAVLAAIILISLLGFSGSWWYVAAQAARVRGLEEEIAQLERDLSQVAELAESLAEVEAQYKRVRRLLGVDERVQQDPGVAFPPIRRTEKAATRDPGPSDIPGSWPLVQAGFITQEARTGESEQHPGIDIAVPQDSYIRAVGAGVVRAAGVDEVYGEYILIEHADGYESMYGHASRIFVVPGDTVDRHEVIALSGSTGRSTAPHLHFEIRRGGRAIDPLPLLRKP